MAYPRQPLKIFNLVIIRDLALSVYFNFHYWKQNLLFASKITYALYGTGIYLTGTTIITSFSASKETKPSVDEKLAQFPPPPIDSGMSLKQPVWHVLVLGVVTFKIYFLYWAYKNWRDLTAQRRELDQSQPPKGKSPQTSANEASTEAPSAAESELQVLPESRALSLWETMSPRHLESFRDASPHIRALLCLVPYIDNYLFFTLASGIAKLQPTTNSFVAKHPTIWALSLTAANFALSYLAFLKGAYYLLFLLNVLPMVFVQHALNKYWDSVEKPGLLTRHGFTGKELTVFICGALYLGYVLSSFWLLDPSSKGR